MKLRNYGIWGCIPTLLLVNIHHFIGMPTEVRAFMLGLGIGSLIGQGVGLYLTIKEKPSIELY